LSDVEQENQRAQTPYRSTAMIVVSEAEACRWLGRRVSLIGCEGATAATGRLQHVSSRSAFLLQEDHSVELGGSIKLFPLANIERIVSAGSEESNR
jgi:hypothetical protein